MDNESIFIENNQSDYDNLPMSEIEQNDIRLMLTIMLCVSLCHPCIFILKDIMSRCRDKYNIFKLPIHKIKSNDNLLLDECSICLEKYVQNDKIMSLECNHSFHDACIKLWLKNNNTCPQCRENII